MLLQGGQGGEGKVASLVVLVPGQALNRLHGMKQKSRCEPSAMYLSAGHPKKDAWHCSAGEWDGPKTEPR